MKEANKPEEKKNEEATEAKEPTDNFYGKWWAYFVNLKLIRAEKSPCSHGKGQQWEGFQDLCSINQVIQKAPQSLQSSRYRTCLEALLAWSIRKTSASMPTNCTRVWS